MQIPHYINSLIFKKSTNITTKKDPYINSLTLACKILHNFGIWLFDHKFTNFSIKYNVASCYVDTKKQLCYLYVGK